MLEMISKNNEGMESVSHGFEKDSLLGNRRARAYRIWDIESWNQGEQYKT